MYSLLLAVIYLAFISLGLPDSLLGSGWPSIYPDLGVSVSAMGGITILTSLFTIVSSLLSDRFNRKLGTRYVTVISVFLTAFALLGFSVSDQYWQLCLWAVPYGLGAGAIDAGLNNYVALHYSSRHMSWLHCFWGVGTIVSPYIMSHALATTTWHTGYRMVAFLQFGIGVILLAALPLWKVNRKASEEAVKGNPLPLRQVVRLPGVAILVLGFLCYCAAETTAIHWGATFLVSICKMSEDRAAAFESLFFIGITFGRFLSGFLADHLGDRKMILLGGSIVLVGTVLLALPGTGFALSGLGLIGLGCAPIYPSIIHATPQIFGAQRSMSIIGIQMAGAYLGSTVMSPLFGVVAKATTMRLLPFYIAFFTLGTLVLMEKTFKSNLHE